MNNVNPVNLKTGVPPILQLKGADLRRSGYRYYTHGLLLYIGWLLLHATFSTTMIVMVNILI